MRERRFLGTRRSSPLKGRFRDSETTKDKWQSGKNGFCGLHEPERSLAIGDVVKPECDTGRNRCNGLGDDRSSNISQYNKSVNLGESSSIKKFQWNNLLEGIFKSPNSSMKHVSDFGTHAYETSVKNSCQVDGFPDSGVVPILTSFENDNLRNYSVNSPHVLTARNCGYIDASFTSPLANSGTFLQTNTEIPWLDGNAEVFRRSKGEIPRPWEHQDVAKHTPGQPLYDQGGESMSASGVSLGYGVPLSQPKAFPCASATMDDNPPRCSVGINRSREMPDGYLRQDGHGQAPCSNPAEISQTKLMKLAEYGRIQSSLVRIMNGDSSYLEIQRSEMGDTGILPDDIRYGRRPSIVDSIVDKIDGIGSSPGGPLKNGLLWEPNLSTEEHAFPSYHDLTQQSNKTEGYAEGLCSRDTHPDYDYGIEGYNNSEGWGLNTCEREAIPSIPLNYHGYEGEANRMNYQDAWEELPDNDQYFYEKESSHNGILATEQLAMHDWDGDMVKLKQSMDENQIWTNSRNPFASDSDHNLNDEEDTSFNEDIMYLQFGDQLTYPYPPAPSRRNSNKHKQVAGKGIKERLRPPQKIPVSTSSHRRSVLERLGPRVVPTLNTFSVKRKKNKTLSRNLYDFCESARFSDLSEVGMTLTKIEPPEDSKDFKQQVDNAFLRFVKLLNENQAQRRKYVDQGGTGTLKCSICGSTSKEFANTLSLAMHSFKSCKAGCRAEHLGFHKALCVLLGWSDTVAPNGSWVQRMLPAAEASSMKNDLIIWPPVVVVHNISIAQNNPDERMIVSVEELEAILNGIGFSGGKIKVSRGKPANFSILVVAFSATLSGLQEAERLNKFYDDNKHGRAEFQEIDSCGFKNSNERSLYIPGKNESALYGYLGNARDLDKLDFERKKHSVVKSRKEIQAMAVLSLS
ncbi:hypothetical protein L6164_018985 [Bauhinia variegata]|uniref:Uncharacterized protein n=1 Tax=Bauhinia variegata TaxID=167791 RepID=A0ACB9NDS1_BAUVA|nr:hypothetical protein L6164_018985 [Bauhinia variegata]